MFKRILVPLDGSELAELVLPYAQELAGTFHSEMILLNVCEPQEKQYRHMHELYISKMAETVQSRLKRAGAEAKIMHDTIDGEPVAAITEYAKENDIRLVVTATHGRSGILLWAIGSVANKILEKITTPVLLIRAKNKPPKTEQGLFNRVLLPLDGSRLGEGALPYVAELAKHVEMEVVLLQVIVPGQYTHTVGGLNYVRFTDEQMDKARKYAMDYLNKAREQFHGTKARTRPEIRIGDAAQKIINCADEIGAGLMVMSTHGHSGIGRWIFGSVASKVLHAGEQPVFFVGASVEDTEIEDAPSQ